MNRSELKQLIRLVLSEYNTGKIKEDAMNQHIYQVERNGKITTIRSTNDALGVARVLFPDIKTKKIMPIKNGDITKIGDITVTEIDPFIG